MHGQNLLDFGHPCWPKIPFLGTFIRNLGTFFQKYSRAAKELGAVSVADCVTVLTDTEGH